MELVARGLQLHISYLDVVKALIEKLRWMELSPKVSKKKGVVSIRVDKFNANFDLVVNWRLEKLNLYRSIFNDIIGCAYACLTSISAISKDLLSWIKLALNTFSEHL